MKLLEMVKDIKVKYSVSSPQKSMGGLFSLFFFFFGGGKGVFYMGSNIRSCKEGRWKDYGRIFTGMKDL